MDLVSLYYFQELSKDLNMTRTAQRLYISQQTLSNHIHRLEQHYGCPLLYRKPTLSLTCAGEFVLSFAQVVEKEERNLEDILSDIEQQERGTLKLGAGTMRGAWILSQLLPDFHRRYPLVEVRFSDALSTQLEAMVSNGELDFAVVLSGSYSPALLEQQLYQEQVYLCVPESLLRQYYSPDEVRGIKLRSLQGASVRDFARLPFALMDNRLGQRMREYFTREQVHPAVPFTGTATRHILPLCAQGMAACYCTQVGIVANASVLGDQLNIFPLMDQGAPIVQTLSLLRHRQRYLTHYAKYFMELLFQVTGEMERAQVSRVVPELSV